MKRQSTAKTPVGRKPAAGAAKTGEEAGAAGKIAARPAPAEAAGAAAKGMAGATAAGKQPAPAKTAAARGKTPAGSRLSRAEIEALFFRFREARPEPRSELEYTNAYTLLVAVLLSAQSTDVGVNKATRALFARVSTPAEMLALGEERLVEHVRTIGLYRTKAKNVMALSRILVDEHGGAVPAEREALERLPGVGRKTANVVLNVAFHQPTMAVDTHIFRVCNRTGLAPGKTPLAVEALLEAIVPAPYQLHAHHWLILHGRYVCKARKPDCAACIANELCKYDDKTPGC
jgi:endonuclease-3